MTATTPSERRSFHIDRSISVGNIFTFVTLLFAGIAYVMHQDQRQTRNEKDIESLFKNDNRFEAEQARQKLEWREDVKEIKRILEDLQRQRR